MIAWVALGFALDRPLAQQLAALAGTEVSFVYREQDGSSGTISTLDAATAGQLATLGLADQGSNDPVLSTISGEQYLTLSAPLRAQTGTLLLVAQRSQSAAMTQFREMRLALLLIGGAALLGAIVVAVFAGRSAVRPLGVLVAAAREIERGSYSEAVQVSGGEEFKQLAGTFNSMQQGIRDREAHIVRQATHDTLTGLPNREGLRERLAGIPAGTVLSVALVDVHRFRDINASVGHVVGDHLLQAMAARLSKLLGEETTCARIGADQFVVTAAASRQRTAPSAVAGRR